MHKSKIAFVEEADDDSGSSVNGRAGTRVYAFTDCGDEPSTPSRERPNTGKSRRGDQPNSTSESASRSARRKTEDKEHRRLREEERKRLERDEARRARAEKKALEDSSKALKKVRPQARHSQTQPVIQQSPQAYRRGHVEESSYYGVPQPASSGNRPRAKTRPASYYAGQTHPPPHVGSWQQSPMMPMAYSPAGSYPPPQGFPPGPPPMHMPMPPSNAGPPGYFDGGPSPPTQHRDLRSRFERPSSAMGVHPTPPRGYEASDFVFEHDQEDFYARPGDEPQYQSKRSSRTAKHDEDRKRMPPPEFKNVRSIPRRPSTTANPSTPFQPPPQRPASRQGHSRPPRPSHRRSVGFHEQAAFDDDEDELEQEDLFHDMSPEPVHEQRRRSMFRPRRDSMYYEDDEYDIAPARSSRRGSIYGSVPLGSGGVSLPKEDKYLEAMKYQEDVTGPTQVPLTADALRKANKPNVASSRSTRSSASRDESEYNKRSNATGITRSSSGGNGDDFTIKVSGQAVVRVPGGAEIECEDSEITFSHGGRGSGASDQASSFYQLEDGASSRRERKALPPSLPYRPRAPSQADSQSRRQCAPSHAPYEPFDY
ncbi:uncharacterized protein F5Z01DRAFT_375516 [Emericellopsis atlantica]|uniref:Uncharacterized protein n=1 Tax=Emericellopsis atlantica TaxID=2614577 RepID=A0A9P7ZE43_9HYPO|nr:uncharacterized protein F5Z01DRAFT_375516 [Emericellopsis atlantica]KAG9250419.1 hypothetical protein F5Z01DRAFT_375516 [Emericellopsis atlantica]